jgi:3-hydroxybutyryl-CoA dehydratase
MTTFWIGQHASAVREVSEQELTLVNGLILQSASSCLEPATSQAWARSGQELLLGSLVNGLLNLCLPGPGSTLLSQQVEYLAPVFPGDILTARVEVTTWQPEKRLITLKTDCFNQAGRQILTGQAVLAVAG